MSIPHKFFQKNESGNCRKLGGWFIFGGQFKGRLTVLSTAMSPIKKRAKDVSRSFGPKKTTWNPTLETIKGSQTTICLRLTPISETTTDEGVDNESIGNGS